MEEKLSELEKTVLLYKKEVDTLKIRHEIEIKNLKEIITSMKNNFVEVKGSLEKIKLGIGVLALLTIISDFHFIDKIKALLDSLF